MQLFALTIFLSAFLLFLVQPIVAKQLLPWFGGSAAVWTTCMVFFQSALLAGYGYSDWLARRPLRSQARLHGMLAAASLVALPIVPAATMRPTDGADPVGRILLLLAVTIGLPYFVLSTTGPLLQAWFARAFPDTRVYRLYALSNVGSMLALLAYPIAIEPAATAWWQSIGWSAGYALFVLLIIGAAGFALRRAAAMPSAASAVGPQHAAGSAAAALAASSVPSSATELTHAPSIGQQALWLLLAALGSTLLLTVTTHITQNVASVPFLWVLPLSLYLLSFILCFDGQGWYRPRVIAAASMVLGALMVAGLVWRLDDDWKVATALMPIKQAVPLYCAGLFVACMFSHGELAARKPAAAHLTRFYLMVSAGGAAGGVLVGVAAPLVLPYYYEFPAAVTLLVTLATVLVAVPWLRLLGLAALVACVAAFWQHVQLLAADTVLMRRDFYGTLRIKEAGNDERNRVWRLLHGVILHGEQYRAPDFRRLPTTYYGETSGVGRAIHTLRKLSPGEQRIGLVGLGTGTLAVYGRAGDVYRFYELNPQVLRVASEQFTYLADSRARIETALGDARLSLEREAPQRFDVLAIDAFSSDSIPVHLITQQAMHAYARQIAPHGVVAFHISNRYLDLAPVVRQLADAAGMQAVRINDEPASDSWLQRSDWVLVTRNAALADALRAAGGEDVPQRPELRAWTDDFNNLWQVLK